MRERGREGQIEREGREIEGEREREREKERERGRERKRVTNVLLLSFDVHCRLT